MFAIVLRQIALAGFVAIALFGETGPAQPIPFSHKTHVSKGLRCQFCHSNAEAENVGLPEADKCMTCHATIAKDKPSIQALRDFAQSKKPIPWMRVYSLPAAVYWSHRPHLAAGVTCESCHGQVSEMDVVTRATNVTTMQGCMDCHKVRKVSTGCNFCHDDK
jgi:hypothetical protein